MTWGTPDHSHPDYAERQHYHYAGDVSEVAERYHDHDDLTRSIAYVREEHQETWQHVCDLETLVDALRTALTTLLTEGPELAAEQFLAETKTGKARR